MTTWLLSDALRHPTGHCLSWAGPRQSGYPYPEASGLLLSLLASVDASRHRTAELVHALFTEPQASAGVGRRQVSYTFDTAMALRGVLRHLDRLDADQVATIDEWGHLVLSRTIDRVSMQPVTTESTEPRWSSTFGAHESKVAGALVAYADHRPARRSDALAALGQLARDTVALQEQDGRFREHGGSQLTYVHAHCYAVEGLLVQQAAGSFDACDSVGRATDWLARVQLRNGAVRAWHDGTTASGPMRTDATAQTLRLLRLANPAKYADNIAAATMFLEDQLRPCGAMPYEPGSGDLSSWSTIFAVQALGDREGCVEPLSGLELV